MPVFSVFDATSGTFTGRILKAPSMLGIRLKDNERATVGRYDRLCQRVEIDRETDPDTGAVIEVYRVVDYQPPQPSPDYEWNATTKRWQLTPEAAARDRADAQARAEIARLEAQQPRAIRELLIDPNNTDAIQRLDAIDQRIIELRAQLKR